MANPVETGSVPAPAETDRRAERRAARQLRRADEIDRVRPGQVTEPASAAAEESTPSPAREARRLARIAERRAAAGQAPAAQSAAFSPEELRRRRELAIRLRQEMAKEAAADEAQPEAATEAEPAERSARGGNKHGKSLRGVAADAPAMLRGRLDKPRAARPTPAELTSPEAAAAAPQPRLARTGKAVVPAEAPAAPAESGAGTSLIARGGPMTDEERASAKRAAKKTRGGDLPPLPDTWRAGLPPELGPVLLTPARAAPRPSAGAQLRAWLAAHPGVRGGLVGLAMLLFWEICRLWSGALPSPVDLLFDLALWAVAGLIAWRLLVWREAHHA